MSGFDFILGDSFLKNVYTSFDYGDWTPDNRTAGVPFVQMLATTDLEDANREFTSVRGKEIVAEEQELANPSSGALNMMQPMSIKKRDSPEQTGVRRIIFVTHGWPARVIAAKQRVSKCANEMTDSYGAVAVAILAGMFALVSATFVLTLAIGIRQVLRWQHESEGYTELDEEAKDSEAVLFDADRPYNHHVTTQYQSMTHPPSYP